MKKTKICFVSLDAGNLLTQEKPTKTHGIAAKQLTLAIALTNLGYNISFIIYDHKDLKASINKDINLIKAYNVNSGIPILRYFYPRLMKLWKSLKNAKADLYIQEGASHITGITAYFCKKYRKSFIYCISNEKDVNGNYIKGKVFNNQIGKINNIRLKYRDGIIYKFGLERANAIISQNVSQKRQLKANHKLDSLIIKTGQIITPVKEYNNGDKIIWVGNLRDIKCPHLYLDLVKKIPDAEFQMIGGPASNSQKLYDEVLNRSKSIENLEFVGYVPYNKIHRYYEEALILVNTSQSEGGPIIFQEAWIRNIPVVSLNVDPDEAIYRKELGFHSKTFENMVKQVRILLKDDELRRTMGRNGRKYVEKNHDINKVVNKYVDLFNSLKNNNCE